MVALQSVADWTKRARFVSLFVVGAMVMGVALDVAPTRSEANECLYAGPSALSDVTGNTWSGRLLAARPNKGVDRHSWKLTFQVTKIHAGLASTEIGDRIRLFNAPCHEQPLDMGLTVGRRYLISSSTPPRSGRLNTDYIVIWEVSDRRTQYRNGFYGSPSPLDSTFRSKTTLTDSLALVVPGGSPSAASPSSTMPAQQLWLIRFLGGLGELLWTLATGRLPSPGP